MKNAGITLLLIFNLLVFKSQGQYTEFEVKVSGKGEPVLLIPGFTCTAEVWDATVSKLSSNYQCHVFTLAGFGDVEPISFPWLPQIKDALLAYIKDKELVSPVVIGHSLGGTMALWLASEETNLFKKLIIVDALPSTGALMIPDFNPETIVYDNPYSKRILDMDNDNFLAMAKQMSSFMALNKEVHSQLTDWIVQSDRETYVKGYTDLLKLDLREDISKINIPVTILAATHPNKEMMQMQYVSQFEKLKQKDVIYAENSAHFIMYDRPQWFISTILRELQ